MASSKIKQLDDRYPVNAYEVIRRRIVSLEYAPGISLDEKSLVTELGLSRTPVREALIRLSGEGLIQIEKNKGAKVSNLDLTTLQSIFEAGDLIERAYTRLACLRRSEADLQSINLARLDFEQDLKNKDVAAMVHSNTEFHLRIAAASGNQYFLESYRRILADHERIAQIWYTRNCAALDQTSNQELKQQHNELYLAIVNRDAAAAEQISIQHARSCKQGIRSILSSGEELVADLHVDINAF